MRHNLTSVPDALPAMRVYQGPRLVILSRAARPPIPILDADDKERAASEAGTSASGGKKEQVGFSKKSSLNLARVLSSIDWARNGTCVHITLTYWRRWPAGGELTLSKQALVMWFGRLVVCGIWRLEFQTERHEKFGEWVPHFHVLAWLGSLDAGVFECRLRKWWAEFSGNPSEHGVRVTCGDQTRGTWYLAMHAAKAAQSPPFRVGRWWGYINRDSLLGAQDLHCTGEVNDRELVWWARIYRRSRRVKVRQRGRCPMGISWFLPRSSQCVLSAWIRDRVEDEKRQRFKPKNPF